MSIKEQRKTIIEDCFRNYITIRPKNYSTFVRLNKEKRLTAKDKFGSDGTSWEDKWTHTMILPAEVVMAINKRIDREIGKDEPRFLDAKGETEWFKKTFSEFKASEK